MKRLLLDQGLPRSAAAILRLRGWEVDHVGERGLSQATDLEIIALARGEGRAVVTLDADFHALIAVSGSARPSAIRIRQEGLKGEQIAELIEKVFAVAGRHIESGALVTTTGLSLRVKHLPIVKESEEAGQ